jgi:NTE family protein
MIPKRAFRFSGRIMLRSKGERRGDSKPTWFRSRQLEVLPVLESPKAPSSRENGSTDCSFGSEHPGSSKFCIGLALGGGAARGFAHIGVLRVLLAHGIKPDVITGTSIGAVIGGCYATGHLDEVESWARSLTRRRVFGYLDFSLGGSGLIGGDRLLARLERELGDVKIEDLPVRFAAIATEIGTGHEIWLTRGRLVDALQASYALPGIFPPVRIGGRWLMDGALVNPVPVSAARALGARLVIGVNLNADNFGRGTIIQDHGPDAEDDVLRVAARHRRSLRDMFRPERLLKRQFVGTPGRPGLSSVMVEAFQVVQDRITRARLAGDPPDALLSPRLGRLGLFDFHRADEAIALGAEAAERALESISEASTALV